MAWVWTNLRIADSPEIDVVCEHKRVFRYQNLEQSLLRRSIESMLSAPLSMEPHPKAPRTFAECVLATLENIAHRFADIGVFQATSDIANWR